MPTWLPAAVATMLALVGGGGLIGILYFQYRASKIHVETSQELIVAMQMVVDEITESADRVRRERDALIGELRSCRDETSSLRRLLREDTL